ncbi:hypothetical protein HN51_057537 [Arachis hypogaea]
MKKKKHELWRLLPWSFGAEGKEEEVVEAAIVGLWCWKEEEEEALVRKGRKSCFHGALGQGAWKRGSEAWKSEGVNASDLSALDPLGN